jgi:signal transduction histidine kinase
VPNIGQCPGRSGAHRRASAIPGDQPSIAHPATTRSLLFSLALWIVVVVALTVAEVPPSGKVGAPLSGEELRGLAREQAALRRVATLVARGAPPGEVFAAVTEEVGLLLGAHFAGMGRFDNGDTVTVLGTWAVEGEQHPLVPGPWPLEGGDLASMIWQTGRPVRIDDYDGVPGPIAKFVREQLGICSSVASPIVVEGRLWGTLFVHSKKTQRPLPPDTESRLTGFTELVATAIANAESRAALARLAEEQAALRRVATLVADGVPPEEVFAAVAAEVGRLLPVDSASMCRYESDGTLTFLAQWGTIVAHFPVGSRWALGGRNLGTLVLETGRPARIDGYADRSSGPLGASVREAALHSAVATPIMVDGRLWGLIAAGSILEQPLPPDTEARLASFTELMATAVANAESRAALAASRARIVAAADETRRQIERDLHDGTQQHLMSLMLELRAAEATEPGEVNELRDQIERTAQGLAGVVGELREISRGIHPAILSRGGLAPALRALARRSALPVELDLRATGRLPEQIEVAVYYVVSEALANAAKHAHASIMHVDLHAHDTSVRLAIRDDGVGGADPAQGSGLVGLRDRIEAVGGELEVTSPAGHGTTLLIKIPAGSPPNPGSPGR